MNNSRLLQTLTILVMTAGLLTGQEIVSFSHLTTDQGLVSPKYNNFVHKDQQGLVWISSIAGIHQFDGIRVKSYRADENDPTSILLEVGQQSKMQEDASGNLWFSAGVALSRYNRLTDDFSHFYHISTTGDTVRTLYQWSYVDPDDGTIFSSAGRQLFAGHISAPDSLRAIDSVFVGNQDYLLKLRGNCYKLIQPRIGEPLVVVNVYCNRKRQRSDTLTGPNNVVVIDAVFDPEKDRLLVATSRSLYWASPGQPWEKVDLPQFDGVEITAIERHGSDRFIVGTKNQGLFIFRENDQSVERLLHNNGSEVSVFGEPVTYLYLDDDQVLWVSTKESGVHYTSLVSRKFHHLHYPDKSRDRSVVAISEANSGDIYALFPDHIEILDGQQRSSIDLPPKQSDFDEATSILVDSKGRTWVGTYSSLLLLEPEGKRFRRTNFCLPGDLECAAGVTSIQELSTGELLVSTNSDHPYIIASDLSSSRRWITNFSRATNLELGTDGLVVVSTYNDSLVLLQHQQGRYKMLKAYSRLGLITSIKYDDRIKGFWIARYGGLHCLELNEMAEWELREITSTKGEIIAAMEQGEEGNIWFSTPGYLKLYLPQADSLIAYSLADGIQGDVHNLGASFKRANGDILFGGANGITVVGPERLNSRIAAANPAITSVKVNGLAGAQRYTDITNGNDLFLKSLRVPYDSAKIELAVSALEYSDPESCNLYYSLTEQGQQSQKVPVGESGIITLERLREGTYTLRLWATNADGALANTTRQLRVIVNPPWYRTWWAYSLYALTIIGVTSVIGWIYLRGKRRAEREELRAAQAESLAAQAQADVAKAEAIAVETEISVLRLQMSPHFIFNSLNSINGYVIEGDKESAHDYLIEFSALIREILYRSAKPLTRLDKAIDLLKDYLKVEQKRLSEKLEFRIEIEEEVDTLATYIPTMILQPFVENSIKHGISGLDKGGTITLRFGLSANASMLVVEVEDDGRGRAATKQNTSKHKSMATDITNRRLELLNKYRPAHSSMSARKVTDGEKSVNLDLAHCEIIDLYTEQGNSAGTKVIVHLPLDYPQYDESSSY